MGANFQKPKQDKRKEQQEQERSRLRQRLIKIIDSPSVSDSEALQAISLLWSMDAKTYR